MTNVVYQGPMGTREFSAGDLTTLGFEDAKKMTFVRGEEVEVDGALAEVLLDKKGPVRGQFKEGKKTSISTEAEVTSKTEDEGELELDPHPQTSGKSLDAPDSSTANTSTAKTSRRAAR